MRWEKDRCLINVWLKMAVNGLEEMEIGTMEQTQLSIADSSPQLFRSEVWQTCLGVANKDKESSQLSITFGSRSLTSIAESKSLREDCFIFLDSLSSGDEVKANMVDDLESILLFYSKSTKIKYVRGNGWIEMISVLLSLKLDIVTTFRMFRSMKENYIFSLKGNNTTPYHLFRLLVLYHDPATCSFLDSKRVPPQLYCCTWFQTLFAGKCSFDAVQAIWDHYLKKSDPFFIFFLALVMLIHAKETLLEMNYESKDTIVNMLANLPCSVETEDVPDFFSLAEYYASRTPSSFSSTHLRSILFSPSSPSDLYSQELCISIAVEELCNGIVPVHDRNTDDIRYFIIDCRPEVQYKAGHLPTAFHLDCDLMTQQPEVFNKIVSDILSAQRRALTVPSPVCGDHLCFMGSGRNEEDQYLNMIVAGFLQKHTQHVSIVTGGYQNVHLHFSETLQNCDARFVDHDPRQCLVCLKEVTATKRHRQPPTKPSPDIIEKLSKFTSEMMSFHINTSNASKAHVDPKDNGSKRYRNLTPTFSIGDEMEESLVVTEDETNAVVPTTEYLNNPDIINAFKCSEISLNCYLPRFSGHVVLTEKLIIILRDITGLAKYSRTAGRRAFENVVKVSLLKSNPQQIIFRYKTSNDGDINNTTVDKYLVRKEKDSKILVKLLLKQIDKIYSTYNIHT